MQRSDPHRCLSGCLSAPGCAVFSTEPTYPFAQDLTFHIEHRLMRHSEKLLELYNQYIKAGVSDITAQ